MLFSYKKTFEKHLDRLNHLYELRLEDEIHIIIKSALDYYKIGQYKEAYDYYKDLVKKFPWVFIEYYI